MILAAGLVSPAIARAQGSWPDRPIKLIILTMIHLLLKSTLKHVALQSLQMKMIKSVNRI